MLESLLLSLEEFFWGYAAFVLIMSLGVYLTAQSRFFQFRLLPDVVKNFFDQFSWKGDGRGIHPLKAFFASTGGMIGIGNVVAVATAIQLGGPGALLWVWIAAAIGSVVKYGEIYLGFKYRVENLQGGYNGGPLYYLKKAFGISLIPTIVAVLLCIYGVEIYQFSVITESINQSWGVPFFIIVPLFLAAVLWAANGGVKRIGDLCTWILPFFLIVYLLMGIWVLYVEAAQLPTMLLDVFNSAFSGHAAVGGFAGSTVIYTIQQGIARAAYSSDVGIGYDSIIQSESNTKHPIQQARLALFGVFVDISICTVSMVVVLLSGVWATLGNSVEGSQLVQSAFGHYFPYMRLFLPLFYLITGYTTIISYLCVGCRCMCHFLPTLGTRVYLVLAALAFVSFSFLSQHYALLVMSLSGAMLLIFNVLGIFLLRNEIQYDLVEEQEELVLD
jgi:alanine or glycine:cation symporter, AGCS family